MMNKHIVVSKPTYIHIVLLPRYTFFLNWTIRLLQALFDLNSAAVTPPKTASMYESEVQSLVAFSCRGLKIVGFLLRRQLLPLPFFALVAPHVILLHRDVQYNVKYRDGDQGAVSFLYK